MITPSLPSSKVENLSQIDKNIKLSQIYLGFYKLIEAKICGRRVKKVGTKKTAGDVIYGCPPGLNQEGKTKE